MSLRSLIEAKQRRTAKLPILVGDLAAAAAEVATFRAALEVHQQVSSQRLGDDGQPSEEDAATEEGLRAQLAAAKERQAACVVEVELQALPADEWDALFGPIEPDESGDLDMTAIHAPLLAASCVDPELQDVEWWARQLKEPRWTRGDRGAISQVLLDLNCYAPAGVPGKD